MRCLVVLIVAACSSQLPTPQDVKWPAGTDQASEQPFSLTASDGSGLALVRVDAKAVVEGPLAFTELHLYFHNSEPREREGRFAMALPGRAALSRFAMQIGDHMQEAEVVPKALARRAYEDFLHRRQDPALLEKSAGNEFVARVYPIPAHADKQIVIAFSQELAGEYVLPLRGLPEIAQLDVTLDATRPDGTHGTYELHHKQWKPDRDFTAGVLGPAAVAADGVVAMQLVPDAVAAPDHPTALTLLVDTSASRALGFARYIDSLGELASQLRALYGDIDLQVVAFDQTTQLVYAGPVSGFTGLHRNLLLERGADGASDLGQALAWLSKLPKRRVVLVGDGVVTAGADRAQLVAAVGQLGERFDVVLAGGIRDDGLAAALAAAGKRPGDVFDVERGASGVAAGLGARVLADVPIEVEGATWSFPTTVRALRAGGDPVIVYAKTTATELSVMIGDQHHRVTAIPGTRSLIRRAVAGAEIAELEQRLAVADDPTLRAQIAQRSVAERVISNETAMLVLETEADYVRYGIDRKALTDILVIGPRGVEPTHRTTIVLDPDRARPVEEEPDEGRMGKPDDSVRSEGQYKIRSQGADPMISRQQAIETARSAGSLGSSSRSNGGFSALTGTGDISTGFDSSNVYGGLGNVEAGRAGWGPSRARSQAPAVSIAMPTVQGSLDKTFIRRYINRQLAKVTYCYERELQRKRSIEGTITVQFVIGTSGKVASASASGFDADVGRCIADVIKAIEFPGAPGTVQVNYPFTFRIAGNTSPVEPDRWVPPPPDPTPAVTDPPAPQETGDALTGTLETVMDLIDDGKVERALAVARKWRTEAPGDVLAVIALGEALEAARRPAAAARAYGSIIDLFPARADMRRFAGERLARVSSDPTARRLAVDTFRRAVADRPDHVTGHRLLAHALIRNNDHAGAFRAVLAGIQHAHSTAGATRILEEDAGLIGAAYLAHGGKRDEIERQLGRIPLPTQPSTRFILYWETDVNDVDFHIKDRHGDEAFYSNPRLASGGELYADVTSGYGPECFAIPGKLTAGPYHLSLHYYSQGPMGYGMGLLQIERFDGKDLTFEDRPYVIMKDGAFVDLGSVR